MFRHDGKTTATIQPLSGWEKLDNYDGVVTAIANFKLHFTEMGVGVFLTGSCSVHTHTCSAAVIYWKLKERASRLVGFQRDSQTRKVAKGFWSHCLGHFYCGSWRFTLLSIISPNLSVCDQPKRMWEQVENCESLWGASQLGSFQLGVFEHGTNKKQERKAHTLSCQQAAPNNVTAHGTNVISVAHTDHK